MKLTRKHLLAAALVFAIASTNANAGKLYKWVDKNGVVSYQDQPPPKNAKILSEKTVKSGSDSGASAQATGLPKVRIYTVEDCATCEHFVTMMKKANVPHIELPLESDRDAQRKILAKTDSLSAPAIFIGDEIIQTNSGATLRKALTTAGYKVEEEDDAS